MNDVGQLHGEDYSRAGDSLPHIQGTPTCEVQSELLSKQSASLPPTPQATPSTQVASSDPSRHVLDAPDGDLVALGVNLAAERLAQGKKVVLLAETPERRDAFIAALTQAGLGDVGVQIDARTSHISLLKDLEKTLALPPPASPKTSNQLEQREMLAARLALYAQALGTEAQASGLTPYDALGASLASQTRESQSKTIDFSSLALQEWDRQRVSTAIELAKAVDELFDNGVAPVKNPWRGCMLAGDLPAAVPVMAKETFQAASLLSSEALTLLEALGLPVDISEDKLEKVLSALKVIDSLESAGGTVFRQVNLRSIRPWTTSRAQIQDALRSKLDYARCFRDLGDKIDFFALRSVRINEATQIASEHHGKNFLGRAVDGQYRRMISQLASVCTVPTGVEGVIKTLGHLERLQRIQTQSEEASEVLQAFFTDTPLFGESNTAADLLTEWRQRTQIASAVFKATDVSEALEDRTMLTLLKQPDKLYEHSSKLHEVRSLLERYKQSRAKLFAAIDMEQAEQKRAFSDQPITNQLKRLQALAADTDCWGSWRRFVEVSKKAQTHNLSFITAYGLSPSPLRKGLAAELTRAWQSAVASDFFTSRPSITTLDLNRSALVERMLTADRAMRDEFAATVARKHWEDLPRFACGGEASVLHELVSDPSLCDSPDDVIGGVAHALQATKPLIVVAPSVFTNTPGDLRADCIIMDKGISLAADHPLLSKEERPELLQLSDELPVMPEGSISSAAKDETTDTLKQKKCAHAITPSERDTTDKFAAHLRSLLENELGLTVQSNVTTSHGVVDLAVVDSSNPARFRLCIVLDGPRYQTAASILEEEHAREAMAVELTARAPQREWVLEWYSNPGAQKRRFMAAVRNTLNAEAVPVERGLTRTIERQSLKPEHAGLFAPYSTAVLDGSTARLLQRSKGIAEPLIMADVVACIVQQEGPIHRDELIARFAQLSGLRQIGDNHLLHIIEGVQLALRNGQIIMRDDCAYTSQKDQTIHPRMRGNLPGTLARFERIPPDELQAAICTLVKNAHGISQEELPSQLFAAFGYKAPPFAGDKLLQQALRYLLEKGVLIESGERVFVKK